MDMEKFLTSKTSFVFLMVSNLKPGNSVTVEGVKGSGLAVPHQIREKGTAWKIDGLHQKRIPNTLRKVGYLFVLCVGRGSAPALNQLLWRALSELRKLHSHYDSGWKWRDPEGRARANMVLGLFAETKGPRLQGRRPASNNSSNNHAHGDSQELGSGMSIEFVFGFGSTWGYANTLF